MRGLAAMPRRRPPICRLSRGRRVLLVAPLAVLAILALLLDAFETMILPRRNARRFSLSRVFFRLSWPAVRLIAERFGSEPRREAVLGFYGPLSLIFLFVLWASLLVAGFGLLQWSIGAHLEDGRTNNDLVTTLFFSGETFFTLGLGDVAPTSSASRFLAVIEAGTGFGFLAMMIGYLPVLYQSFARREVAITLLDARASSPPSAGELLRRTQDDGRLERVLISWEQWAAELLESHLSYPVLGFFRSHHDHQSWVGMLTVVLDTSAVVLSSERLELKHQAQLTFAMARHAAVDLAQVVGSPDRKAAYRALPAKAEWREMLGSRAVPDGDALAQYRDMYEPYCRALAIRTAVALPEWLPPPQQQDDWQTTDAGT